jgi:hypothetical protein
MQREYEELFWLSSLGNQSIIGKSLRNTVSRIKVGEVGVAAADSMDRWGWKILSPPVGNRSSLSS